MSRQGLPGGAAFALTTSARVVDLRALIGCRILLSCDEQDIDFSFAPDDSSTTLVTATDTAASLTALVAEPTGAGVKVERQVMARYPYLVVRTQTSTGTLIIKPTGRS